MADKRDHLKPWKAGCGSPNPRGRPKHSKNKKTLFAEALLEGEAEGIVRKVIELALKGDVQCLKMCMDRLIPPKKQVEITGASGGQIEMRLNVTYTNKVTDGNN